jgi:hypothetical protein
MEQTQLDIFRRALIFLREEIEQLNTDSKDAAGTVALDQSKVGRLSRMDALQAQQMAQETARRRQLHTGPAIISLYSHFTVNDYSRIGAYCSWRGRSRQCNFLVEVCPSIADTDDHQEHRRGQHNFALKLFNMIFSPSISLVSAVALPHRNNYGSLCDERK